MLKNNLVFSFGRLLKDKVCFGISVTGLIMGVTCCIIAAVFVNQELSYDRFHKNSQHIYRLCFSLSERRYPISSTENLQHLMNELPGLKSYTRVGGMRGIHSSVEDKKFDISIIYADPNFFDIFSFQLLAGDPEFVLSNPNSAVVSTASRRE